MKLISYVSRITLLCLGLSVAAIALPVEAQQQPNSSETATSAETILEQTSEPLEYSVSEPVLFLLLDTGTSGLLTEDANSLNRLAERINQDVNGRSPSDDFLPEGMVVRGSGSGLQLGGEL